MLCCVVVWCGVLWCGVLWCGVLWCGVGGLDGKSEPIMRLFDKVVGPAGHGTDVVESAALDENQDLKVLRPQLVGAPLETHVPDKDQVLEETDSEEKRS